MADVPGWLFSVCAFISFVLVMIPLPWHLEAWNTGTCMYMIWTGVACLIQFINSIVWSADAEIRIPVWCDITTTILIGTSVALPAASLCINRRLYKIASVQTVTTPRAERRREIMLDLAIGVGFPFLIMGLHPIVQANRFVIYEGVGCYPFTFNTPPAYVLVFCWPVIIGLISATYCIRTIRELALRRAQFKEFLATNRNLTGSRYFRLMGLAGVEVLLTIPLGCWSIYLNATVQEVQPYVSWEYVHAEMNVIDQVPAALWQSTPLSTVGVEASRWFLVLCAVIFFAFFGFADEARKNYRLAYTSIAKRVGLSTGSISATGTWTANGTKPDMSYNGGNANMPVFITHQTEQKRESMASYSSRMSLPDYGGALGDLKKDPFSPTATTSGSISKESLPKLPIDYDNVHLPTLPEASLDASAPPRYVPDATHAV